LYTYTWMCVRTDSTLQDASAYYLQAVSACTRGCSVCTRGLGLSGLSLGLYIPGRYISSGNLFMDPKVGFAAGL